MSTKLTVDEVFGALPQIANEEVELDRTPDYGDLGGNWTSPMKRFSLGLHNANNTVLSNMVAKKINEKETYGLAFFLDHMQMTQQMFFQFILDMLDKILSKERK